MKPLIRWDLSTSCACLLAAGFAVFSFSANADEEVKTTVQNIASSSLEPLRRIRMNRGTNELLVVAPQELRIDLPAPARVTLAGRDLAYSLSVRVLSVSPVVPPSDLTQPGAEWVREQYPGARITAERSLPVGEKTCTAVDFVLPVRGARDRLCKVGLVPTAAGVVEFLMIADPEAVPAASENFNALLRSFQTNERGPIKLIPLPDHS